MPTCNPLPDLPSCMLRPCFHGSPVSAAVLRCVMVPWFASSASVEYFRYQYLRSATKRRLVVVSTGRPIAGR